MKIFSLFTEIKIFPVRAGKAPDPDPGKKTKLFPLRDLAGGGKKEGKKGLSALAAAVDGEFFLSPSARQINPRARLVPKQSHKLGSFPDQKKKKREAGTRLRDWGQRISDQPEYLPARQAPFRRGQEIGRKKGSECFFNPPCMATTLLIAYRCLVRSYL